jgi:hypothetical protein
MSYLLWARLGCQSAGTTGPCTDASAPGTATYVDLITVDHPAVDPVMAAANAQLDVAAFTSRLLG